jgi:hypothetical protein
MKRFWLVLLSLGLVMAFSASAFAVDVKFSGSYYAAGMYLDQTNLMKNGTENNNQSTSFYYQKLQVNMDFIVSPGLKLVTRFDALNRFWGGARSQTGTAPNTVVGAADASYSIASRAEEENIAFTRAYVEYASPIGLFMVGYIPDNAWGLTFGQSAENGHATGGIEYILPIGPWIFGGIIYKEADNSYSATYPQGNIVDGDWDRYILFALFNFKGGEAGLMGTWDRLNGQLITWLPMLGVAAPISAIGFTGTSEFQYYSVQPFVKFKIGPVKLEGEFIYSWGSANSTGQGNLPNVTMQDILGYVGATVDLNMFYFGGQFAYMSGAGDGLSLTNTQIKGGYMGGGLDWNPTLIMFNNDLTYNVGQINGYSGTNMQSNPGAGTGIGMTNAWFYQIDGGVRPIPKLDIKAALAYAMADTTASGQNNSYGWELDVTGTYKITNNLSYMLGVGYWWVGDYFKGEPALGMNNQVRDDYMVINKLTLTF